jgi:hypothetical protein
MRAGLHESTLTHHVKAINRPRASASDPLHPVYAQRRVASGSMPPRGIAIDVPIWWLDALRAKMAEGQLAQSDLARLLVPPSLTGRAYDNAFNAARVKVTRFLEGDKRGRTTRTMDVVKVFCEGLRLPPFIFVAATRQEAEAMQLAQSNPEEFNRVVRLGTVMVSLESGETRLDDLLGRQNRDLPSTHEALRGRPRRAGTVAKAPRGERR